MFKRRTEAERSDSLSQQYILKADSELIQWLLHESGQSRYSISSVTNVSESTLSRLSADATFLQRMRFENAASLTAYAKHLKQHEKQIGKSNTLQKGVTE